MPRPREEELESLHQQLEEWQHNLALRVAGEAKALDAELHKLTDDEINELWEVLRTAQHHVFAGTDMLRDLRRRLQTPLFDDQPSPPSESWTPTTPDGPDNNQDRGPVR